MTESNVLQTPNLRLIPQTHADVTAMIDAMSPAEKAQLSADWLARYHASTAPDPWVHGFQIVHRDSGAVVGNCLFKAPPVDGVVEIAYGLHPEHWGKGYATEAAKALVDFAFASGQVRVVRAHTLPQPNASTRVLTKSGFLRVGEVIDPEDGLVWRFERERRA
ncbi:MAG TPA: GNAT family N-acetyltransferase [Steroidobacteraceae bacterium]|nr:GNAT family N-acetyltransferase [Steroidobacteraceae bacterium]